MLLLLLLLLFPPPPKSALNDGVGDIVGVTNADDGTGGKTVLTEDDAESENVGDGEIFQTGKRENAGVPGVKGADPLSRDPRDWNESGFTANVGSEKDGGTERRCVSVEMSNGWCTCGEESYRGANADRVSGADADRLFSRSTSACRCSQGSGEVGGRINMSWVRGTMPFKCWRIVLRHAAQRSTVGVCVPYI